MCFKIYKYDKLLTVPKRKINIKTTRNFRGSLLRIRKMPYNRKLISTSNTVSSHNFRYNISDKQQNFFSEHHILRNYNQPSASSQNHEMFYSSYCPEHYQYQHQVSLMTIDSKVTGDTVNEPIAQQTLGHNIFDYNLQQDNPISFNLNDDPNLIENEVNLLNVYTCHYCVALQGERIHSRKMYNFPQNTYVYAH